MHTELVSIYGKHAVGEALAQRPDVVSQIFLSPEGSHETLRARARERGIQVNPLNVKQLPKDVPPDAVHQGVIAFVAPFKLGFSYEEFIQTISVTNDTAFIILGEVQDPQNVGSIIRSAAAFGVAGILFPEHRQAPINGTVVKVSAGTAFSVPLVTIGNVNSTITDLKSRGFWIYGLDQHAPQSLYSEGFEKPSVFVVGNEATGIREKTREHCDIPLMIPMSAHAESLNAATATAVVLSHWSAKHPGVLR